MTYDSDDLKKRAAYTCRDPYEEPEGSFVRFDDDDDDEITEIDAPYEAKRRDGWRGLVEQDLTEVQADVGGYGLAQGLRSPSAPKQWVPYPSRPIRRRVRQRDGTSVVETVALTKKEWDRRVLLCERNELLFNEVVGLSGVVAERFLKHLVKKKINPSLPLTAPDPTQQNAADEALEAWRRLNAAWKLITPICETPGCSNPAKHHSVPKVRPKVPRESCEPCNQYFRNHQTWPVKGNQ